MASDGHPVQIPATSLVHGSQAPTAVVPQRSGKVLPQPGKAPAAPAAPRVQAQVALLNKYLNDSGKPDQFRVDPSSDGKMIQQVNPASGQVIGEFPASEFAALARSVGVSGVIIDQHV
jgi:uncharacterized FlaG/YvyC family protein